MRGSWSIFFFCVIFPLAAVAGEVDPTAEPTFTGEITLGATFPLSGPHETYGQSAFYGANTCVRLINQAGGVNGKKLVLIWRDNGSSDEQAVRDVEELAAQHKVPAILGPLLSEATLAATPVAERLGVVVMSPMATMDALTRDSDWVFRACFTSSAEAEGLVRFQMEKYGAMRAGIMFDPRYAFADELAGIFGRLFRERGGIVVGTEPFVDDSGKMDYVTPLKSLSEKKPDFIFAASYALEATELVHAARDAGVATRLVGPDTWDNQLVFDGAGSRLVGTCVASALYERAFSYRPFQTFFTAMEQAGMDNPDAQAACAYDAVRLLAKALESGERPEDIQKGLLAIKRISLATGRISISPEGDAIKPVLIRVIERSHGQLIPVYAERYDP